MLALHNPIEGDRGRPRAMEKPSSISKGIEHNARTAFLVSCGTTLRIKDTGENYVSSTSSTYNITFPLDKMLRLHGIFYSSNVEFIGKSLIAMKIP